MSSKNNKFKHCGGYITLLLMCVLLLTLRASADSVGTQNYFSQQNTPHSKSGVGEKYCDPRMDPDCTHMEDDRDFRSRKEIGGINYSNPMREANGAMDSGSLVEQDQGVLTKARLVAETVIQAVEPMIAAGRANIRADTHDTLEDCRSNYNLFREQANAHGAAGLFALNALNALINKNMNNGMEFCQAYNSSTGDLTQNVAKWDQTNSRDFTLSDDPNNPDYGNNEIASALNLPVGPNKNQICLTHILFGQAAANAATPKIKDNIVSAAKSYLNLIGDVCWQTNDTSAPGNKKVGKTLTEVPVKAIVGAEKFRHNESKCAYNRINKFIYAYCTVRQSSYDPSAFSDPDCDYPDESSAWNYTPPARVAGHVGNPWPENGDMKDYYSKGVSKAVMAHLSTENYKMDIDRLKRFFTPMEGNVEINWQIYSWSGSPWNGSVSGTGVPNVARIRCEDARVWNNATASTTSTYAYSFLPETWEQSNTPVPMRVKATKDWADTFGRARLYETITNAYQVASLSGGGANQAFFDRLTKQIYEVAGVLPGDSLDHKINKENDKLTGGLDYFIKEYKRIESLGGHATKDENSSNKNKDGSGA